MRDFDRPVSVDLRSSASYTAFGTVSLNDTMTSPSSAVRPPRVIRPFFA